ncbi:MAG: transcription antitermination factor NusB [Candidatus Aminicenantes bacterium]
MGKRRKARESTLQILFQLEFDNTHPQKTIARYWEVKKAPSEVREYSSWLINGILSRKQELDNIIQSVSEHWRISRMALVDRNILRMAVFELLYEENMPAAVVINEAIEIAKKYSSDEAATFVNGILDAIKKNLDSLRESKREREK